MLVSALAILIVLVAAALAFGTNAIVWSFPAYRRFRDLVHALERAPVTGLNTATTLTNVTLRQTGQRRIEELFVTTSDVARPVGLRDCFGALYLKDETIDGAISTTQFSSGVFLIFALLGSVYSFLADPELPVRFEELTGLDKQIEFFVDLLLHNHLILLTEAAVAMVALIFLWHVSLHLTRFTKQYGKT